MEKARQWLEENGSYVQGVELLRALGGSVQNFTPYLKNRVIAPEAKDKLRAAIHALLPTILTTPTTPDEPEVLTQYRAMGRRMLKIQADLHTRIKVADTDAARYELAEQLMEDVIPEVDRIYDAIRAYENDKVVPPAPEVDAVRIAAKKLVKEKYLHDRLIRLRRWLEAGKKDGRSLSEVETSAYEKEVLEKTAELEALRLELGLNKET